MPQFIVGRLERDGETLADEIETTIDGGIISFPFTRGEAWHRERHRLVTPEGRAIDFIVERKGPYGPDPTGDVEMVYGEIAPGCLDD